MKILVTAFDPFGGEDVNAAMQAVRLLPQEIGGAQVVTAEIPTVFDRSVDVAVAAIEAHHPDAVVCVGQAVGRSAVTPERVAINVDDARIPDNAAAQPIDRPIVAGAPAAYFATLPVKAMVAAIRAAGVPAALSNSAGTFVCNHLMYGVLHHLAVSGSAAVAGFVHVPATPAQAQGRQGVPSLEVEQIARGLEAALQAVVTPQRFVGDAGAEGTLH